MARRATTGGARRGGGGRPPFGGDAPTPGSPADLTPDADPVEVARAIALRQLTMGPRTRAQLADALARRGVPVEVAEQVLDRFEQVDLVDDEAFAQLWVRSRHLGRGLARRALAHELRQRGVADDVVRHAVDEVRPEDELEAARLLVRRRWSSVARDDPARRTRRLVGMLARKGYGAGTAMTAIREVGAELAGDGPGSDGPGSGGLDDVLPVGLESGADGLDPVDAVLEAVGLDDDG